MTKNVKIVLGALALITLGGLSFYLSQPAHKETKNPEQIACTAEALECPDGSYVGRTEKTCAFTACPNQPSFTGKVLQKDTNGFRLMLASPSHGGEVAYAMPIKAKAGDILESYVGQNIKVFGSFTEGASFLIDRLEPAGDATRGEVSVGKTIFINGVRVTLNNITQDNRCPKDVQCIIAGWVTANVTLKSNTDEETIDIKSDASPYAFDSFHVSIERVAPRKISTITIKPEDYLLTFRVQ